MTWTIEPHGDGLVLYEGRDNEHHGLNLVYLKEPAHQWPRVRPLIEAAPDLKAALEEVMTWIKNWDPQFVDDPEWLDTQEKVTKALMKSTPPLGATP